jgi:hypothetical protein
MTPRILLDRYVYEDIYPAFKAATDEKEITANLSRTFLNYLAVEKLVLVGDEPIAVADIGCGPCDTVIKYLTGVTFPPGFIIRATDYLAEYADAERGEALRVLRAAQAANTIKLAEFSVRAGDAFGGELRDLLSGPQAHSAFQIVFASHMLYHAENSSDVARMLGDIATNVLARDGVCMMFHVANRRGSFQDFRARFGAEAGAHTDSDTGAVSIDDPPAQIAAGCERLRLPLYQSDFIARLQFQTRRDEDWRAFKDPQTYDALADSNPAVYEDLKRLYFIVQRAPLEFASDHTASGLATFIDEVRRVIEANGGVLPMHECVQVLTRTDASPRLSEIIRGGLASSVSR